MIIKTDIDFAKAALAYYDNPACVGIREFQEDVRRFKTLNRCLSNTENWDARAIRKVVNNVLIIYNIFGENANRMLAYKIQTENIPMLTAIVSFLGRMNVDLGTDSDIDQSFLERINVCLS